MKRALTALSAIVLSSPLLAQETSMDWADILGTEIQAPYDASEHRAFDFWTGHWQADWRGRADGELDYVSDGSTTRQRVFPALDGKVLIELAEPFVIDPETPEGRGFSIRYYIEEENRWVMAQHWPQPGFSGIAFTDQLTGYFDHGRVELFSRRGRPNEDGTVGLRRYVFSDLHEQTFRWDGSNSDDEGATWSTWNVVPFTRIDAIADLTSVGPNLPTYTHGQLCTDAPHRNLDGLVGSWTGSVTDANGTSPATLTAGRFLDGCALMAVTYHTDTGYRALRGYSFTDALGHWVEFLLDNQPGTRHSYRISADADPRSFEDASLLQIENRYDRYLSSERFVTDTALSRTIFEAMSDDNLIIVDQSRDSVDADWVDERRYDLTRIN